MRQDEPGELKCLRCGHRIYSHVVREQAVRVCQVCDRKRAEIDDTCTVCRRCIKLVASQAGHAGSPEYNKVYSRLWHRLPHIRARREQLADCDTHRQKRQAYQREWRSRPEVRARRMRQRRLTRT